MSDKVVEIDTHLTYREAGALRSHMEACKTGKEQPLHPSLVAQFFTLFISGLGCEEIQRANPSIRLGAIVRAHEEYDWWNRRAEYTQRLLSNIRSDVQQVHAESVRHIMLGLTAMHKLHGERFVKYIQSGNPDDLGPFKDWTLTHYASLVNLLLRLTGQDNQKKTSMTLSASVQHSGTVDHQVASLPVPSLLQGPPSADEASRLLEVLYGSTVPVTVKNE